MATKYQWSELATALLKVFEEHGPLTRAEASAILGEDRLVCSAVISRLSKKQKVLPKRLYVYDYVYQDDVNDRYFPRARYAIGDKRNASKPKPDKAAKSKRYRDREKARVASVFHIGIPRRKREELKRQRKIRNGNADRRGPLQETQDSANGIQHGEQLGCVPAYSD